jgi:transcriptional regulator with XRE-family HTH domain
MQSMTKGTRPKGGVKLNRSIGKAIKKAREAKGPDYHQIDLAAAVNLQRSYISELENGKRNPTIGTLVLICQELGVSLGHVIAEAEAEYNVDIVKPIKK